MKKRKFTPKDRFKNCGGKKKGSCNTWAGATELRTKTKVLA